MSKKRLYNRQSYRFNQYDYSQQGLYFITICTNDRVCIFGSINNDEMYLSDIGKIVKDCWLKIETFHPYVVLHDFVIMPNHIHGVIQIVQETVTIKKEGFESTSKTIGSIIRGFKSGVSCTVIKSVGIKNIWQRNYYDRIIRDYNEYQNVTNYIINNPRMWSKDSFYK